MCVPHCTNDLECALNEKCLENTCKCMYINNRITYEFSERINLNILFLSDMSCRP